MLMKAAAIVLKVPNAQLVQRQFAACVEATE